MVRKKLTRGPEDKPEEPYKPKKMRDFGNRFCIKCGHFRPLGFGRKCPWCFVEDGDNREPTAEEKLLEETKAILKARRQRRREEIRQEKTIREKVKRLLSLDRKGGVSREKYTAQGRRSLRAKQAWWLADQLDMLLELFEPDYEGGYLVYKDKLTELTPQIRALKKEVPRIRRTFVKQEKGFNEKKNDFGQDRRPGTTFDIFGPFT